MSISHSKRITIIGGGIIGLTTACTVLKEYSTCHDLRLNIISEHFSPETTGDISAGYWEPYGLEELDERTLRWAGFTYEIFLSEYFSEKAALAGIMKMPAYTLYGFDGNEKFKDRKKPTFSSLVRHFRMLDDREMEMFEHLKPTSGFVMSTIAIEVRYYLREVRRYLNEDSRIKFLRRKIRSFDELSGHTDVIINCTGLGSRELANDSTVRPARGQIIRIFAPWIKVVFNFETDEGNGYIIPQGNSVVLGGTFQLNDWKTSIVESETKKILRMCSKCLPALKDVHRGTPQVGLRPYRDGGVRLEHEKTNSGLNIVHCYGHSGSGVTLSWGCAKDVVEIVKTLIPSKEMEKSNEPEHRQLWRLVPPKSTIVLKSKY